MIDREAVGTLLRHVHDVLDGDVARVQAALGLPPDYRPRFSPVMRHLARGPLSIRDLAAAIGVTHSAASQTVAQMTERGLVVLRQGEDARQRIAHLTPRGEGLLPAVEREWRAVAAAMAELDAELPAPLADVLTAVLAAVERRPFRERITRKGQELSTMELPGSRTTGHTRQPGTQPAWDSGSARRSSAGTCTATATSPPWRPRACCETTPTGSSPGPARAHRSCAAPPSTARPCAR